MCLGVGQDVIEAFLRAGVLDRFSASDRPDLRLAAAAQAFRLALADRSLVQGLRVGQTLEEHDALDPPVGRVPGLGGFLIFMRAQGIPPQCLSIRAGRKNPVMAVSSSFAGWYD
ncbi:MAG: hypothetical protein ACOZB0_01190 [Pseudomonadota bacterium]